MMGKKLQHPGVPAFNGIPNPNVVQNELIQLQQRYEELEKEIKREKNKNTIAKLEKEKSEIGFKLFWMLKPI